MTRQPKNEAFARTSFLHGANAAYIEEMQAQYERNPGSVSDEWRHFFASLQEEQRGDNGHDGPSWAAGRCRPCGGRPRAAGRADGRLRRRPSSTSADRLQARAQAGGFELSPAASLRATQDSIRALMLIRAYRVMGHLAADLDPLGLTERKIHKELRPETYGFTEADLDRPIFIDKVLGLEMATIREIVKILRRTYCRHIGVEFMHITSPAQKSWIQERIEGRDKDIAFTPEGKRAILNKLIEAETFEKFADVKYTGTKRFGLDGAEAMVPALEQIIKRGGQLGVKEIVIGMAHRGRLNVLANVMGKPLRAIFNEFKGGSFKPDDVEGSGDVKYHLGASSDRAFDGNNVHLSLTANPSHLEIVDPVVLGKVRAKQDQHGCKPGERTPVLPLLIHGDAAFAGQGVVAECFGLSGLKGHRTGGSIHFIINNQIGFTTAPRYSRSSPYCSDVAKMVEAPIFHVNGDNPEAVVHVAKIATEFRQRFQKPVVIDMFCYRKHGHNESDEPAFTQPLMYRAIRSHPSAVEIYGKRLVEEGVLTAEDVDALKAKFRAHLDEELAAADGYKPNKADWLDGRWSKMGFADDDARRGETGVAIETLKEVGRRITTIPQDFNAHKTIQRLLQRRREMVETGTGIDWSMAEHLAFGTLLKDGYPVRLSGQDSERGTFSQRHSVLIDQETERRYTPLKYVSPDQAPLRGHQLDAVGGGGAGLRVRLHAGRAQRARHVGGAVRRLRQRRAGGVRPVHLLGRAQVAPDVGPRVPAAARLRGPGSGAFLRAARALPADVRGGQLAGRQLHDAGQLLPHPAPAAAPQVPQAADPDDAEVAAAAQARDSELAEMGPGTTFHRVLWDDAQSRKGEKIKLKPDGEIRRVVLCAGKVYYDLYEAREAAGIDDVYLLRVEQLYPFPAKALVSELSRFPKAEVVWAQEEPRNMGAWSFVEPNIEWVLQHTPIANTRARYAGRPASAATATGLASKHNLEQKTLVEQALAS